MRESRNADGRRFGCAGRIDLQPFCTVLDRTRAPIDHGRAIGRPREVGAPPLLSARLLVGIALVPVAVLVVHEIRYLLAFGDGAGAELDARGHGYVGQVIPPLALACAVALGAFLVRLGQAWQTGSGDRRGRRTLGGLWLAAAVGLLAIHSGQELLEALIAQGRAPSLAVVFGDGGLWSVPAALIIGLLLAFVLRGAAEAVDLVARLGRRDRGRPCPDPERIPSRPERVWPLSPMARSAAGRAPPPASVFACFRRSAAAASGC